MRCQDCGQEFHTSSDYDVHRQDEHLTLRFLCCLYRKSLDDNYVGTYGMKPETIYDHVKLGVDTEWKQRVEMLVANCVLNRHVVRLENTDRIKITPSGKDFCYSNCKGEFCK